MNSIQTKRWLHQEKASTDNSISDDYQVREEVGTSFVHIHAHTHLETVTHANIHIHLCSQTDKAPHREATHACISNACGRLKLCRRGWGRQGGRATGRGEAVLGVWKYMRVFWGSVR